MVPPSPPPLSPALSSCALFCCGTALFGCFCDGLYAKMNIKVSKRVSAQKQNRVCARCADALHLTTAAPTPPSRYARVHASYRQVDIRPILSYSFSLVEKENSTCANARFLRHRLLLAVHSSLATSTATWQSLSWISSPLAALFWA